MFSLKKKETILPATGGANYENFGHSVSISGTYAIVGSYFKSSNKGEAYIFQYNGTTWTQTSVLTASDGATNDYFGNSVSISGTYAIVGAYGKTSNTGAAYIFQYNGTAWTQTYILLATGGANYENFGYSVSISGTYAIVGAPANSSSKGAAYIFQLIGTAWTQTPVLTVIGGANYDYFGYSVSISGTYAIVGAYGNSSSKGAAYIFQLIGTTWTPTPVLTATGGANYDYFGWSVSISGTYAIVGAYGNSSSKGAAYIFQLIGTTWTPTPVLTASDGLSGDQFGYSVSISGTYAIVGAISKSSMRGAAYIFQYNGTTWTQTSILLASDGSSGDYFGYSVSISGVYSIVGGPIKSSNTGAAYVYQPTTSITTNVLINATNTYQKMDIADIFDLSNSISIYN